MIKCPQCDSTSGEYDSYWDEWIDEDGYEDAYLTSYWDCNICNHRVMSYDEGFESED